MTQNIRHYTIDNAPKAQKSRAFVARLLIINDLKSKG
jgi:hypothetical protein